jgi:hypothetical protein
MHTHIYSPIVKAENAKESEREVYIEIEREINIITQRMTPSSSKHSLYSSFSSFSLFCSGFGTSSRPPGGAWACVWGLACCYPLDRILGSHVQVIQSVYRPVGRSASPSVIRSVDQPIGRPARQLVNQCIGLMVGRPACQSVYEPVGRSASLSVNQVISQLVSRTAK